MSTYTGAKSLYCLQILHFYFRISIKGQRSFNLDEVWIHITTHAPVRPLYIFMIPGVFLNICNDCKQLWTLELLSISPFNVQQIINVYKNSIVITDVARECWTIAISPFWHTRNTLISHSFHKYFIMSCDKPIMGSDWKK